MYYAQKAPLAKLRLFGRGIGLGATGGTSNTPTVRASSVGGGSSFTSVTLPTFVAGDLLVVIIWSVGASQPGTPSGWTLNASAAQGTGAQEVYVYTKKAVGGDSFTSTSTISNATYNCWSLTGWSVGYVALPLNSFPVAASPITVGNVRVTQFVLGIWSFMAYEAVGSLTGPAGLTLNASTTATLATMISGWARLPPSLPTIESATAASIGDGLGLLTGFA